MQDFALQHLGIYRFPATGMYIIISSLSWRIGSVKNLSHINYRAKQKNPQSGRYRIVNELLSERGGVPEDVRFDHTYYVGNLVNNGLPSGGVVLKPRTTTVYIPQTVGFINHHGIIGNPINLDSVGGCEVVGES